MRYKHCCGSLGAVRVQSIPHEAHELVPIPSFTASGQPVLSIILPFYRKLREFKRVLPMNLPYFARQGIEVILVMDEVTGESGVLRLLEQHPYINWKMLVNDHPHPWRPPCKAINVGLRHASGHYILIASPESAFVDDVPAYALQVVSDNPNGIAIGRVTFMPFGQLECDSMLAQHFEENIAPKLLLHTFYGSICGPRSAFESIRGYDEDLNGWGGDDDNLRVRLEMAGHTLLACPQMRLLHLSFEPRNGGEQFDADDDVVSCSPASFLANVDTDWGRDFERIAMVSDQSDHSQTMVAESAPTPLHSYIKLPEGAVVPTGSRQRCGICGRLIHYESPIVACTGCGLTPVITQSSSRNGYPKIACVMQLRNEAYYLEGCLAHIRDYVDGIIALDDGSTDATGQILAREPKLLDCIVNKPREVHVWRERENKQRLLETAHQLGVDWVLCCDADERFETAFLENLRAIANSFRVEEAVCISISLKELWDSPHQYRVDGIWGRKSRARFFRLSPEICFEQDQDLHGQWYPDQIRKHGRMLRIYHNLYHLKTIYRKDRIKRRDMYKRLDPENLFQAMGYDYLAEEGEDLRLELIKPERQYDYNTVPRDLMV